MRSPSASYVTIRLAVHRFGMGKLSHQALETESRHKLTAPNCLLAATAGCCGLVTVGYLAYGEVGAFGNGGCLPGGCYLITPSRDADFCGSPFCPVIPVLASIPGSEDGPSPGHGLEPPKPRP